MVGHNDECDSTDHRMTEEWQVKAKQTEECDSTVHWMSEDWEIQTDEDDSTDYWTTEDWQVMRNRLRSAIQLTIG